LGQRRIRDAPGARGMPARAGRGRGDPRRPTGVVGRPGGVPSGRPGGRPDLSTSGAGIAPGPRTVAMSVLLRERPADRGPANGGAPARRAVIRWAWRLFRREWRQQVLVLSLLTVAVAGT